MSMFFSRDETTHIQHEPKIFPTISVGIILLSRRVNAMQGCLCNVHKVSSGAKYLSCLCTHKMCLFFGFSLWLYFLLLYRVVVIFTELLKVLFMNLDTFFSQSVNHTEVK